MIEKRPQRYSELADDLVKVLKRLGQKTNKVCTSAICRKHIVILIS